MLKIKIIQKVAQKKQYLKITNRKKNTYRYNTYSYTTTSTYTKKINNLEFKHIHIRMPWNFPKWRVEATGG